MASDVRTGQAGKGVDREEFGRRFRERFDDPAFDAERDAVGRLEAIAWEAYQNDHKSPRTRPAGPEFEDPAYDISVEWLAARERVRAAAARSADPASVPRVLLVCGASRNDGTCPGEMSKSFRLVNIAREAMAAECADIELDTLDLSLLASDPLRHIHPCKACVSTAMPLCHWPCSCYPNHATGQVNDWMNEIYPRWSAAHGVLIVTPVYWYQAASPLKLMIDRLVCADGGNPDPTRTGGKDAARAKALELAGWDYPKHLAGRAYGVVVHGDAAGAEAVRRALSDWLDTLGLIDAGPFARLDRYVGYYEPYATSHAALDRDAALQDEVRNAARALVRTVRALRAGEFPERDRGLRDPRPK